jgi:ectoine hydroxylase-related dioxygenase (phytanoyl-CoA dioxygenase family)
MKITQKVPKELDEYGYSIINSNLKAEHSSFEELMVQYFNTVLRSENDSSFELLDSMSNYHRIIEKSKIPHHDFIQRISRRLPVEFVDHIFVEKIIAHCEEYLKCKLSITDDIVWFRLCRSKSDDSNDLHRDHWFPNYSDVLNLYVPISGSYSDSAMKVVPKSHLWSDEDVIPTHGQGEKRIKNGIAYSAPGIKYCKHKIITHRPDVKTGDFMIFNPKCVHGGGDNFSEYSRTSLEIRIEIKK